MAARTPDYYRIAKPGSFIADYMLAFDNIETSTAYDFWSACWLVSNAVGRTLTVPRPQAPVHLNLYAILCAESGITRKSTAVRHATAILQEYNNAHQPEFAVVTGRVTPESLDAVLHTLTHQWNTAHIAISSSELVNLLGREKYTSGLPGRLTDLYDCPSYQTRSTVREGQAVARNVYISLLAASTPSWLVRAVNPDVVEGGFTSRCLFVIEDKPKRMVAWPDEQRDTTFTVRCAERLYAIHAEAEYVVQRSGGILPTVSAKRQFAEWYEDRTPSTDAFGSSFQAREDHHILRMAAILAVSDATWEIQEHHVTNATHIIGHVRRTGMALFGSGIVASRTYALVDRIRQGLISCGRSGVSQSTLATICKRHGTIDEQRQVLSVMHEMDLVQKFQLDTPDRGRPTTMWRATRALVSPKALEDVVDMIHPHEEV